MPTSLKILTATLIVALTACGGGLNAGDAERGSGTLVSQADTSGDFLAARPRRAPSPTPTPVPSPDMPLRDLTCPDYDHNGTVDPLDVNAFKTDFLANNMAADFNHNGVIEPSDMAAFINNFFYYLQNPNPSLCGGGTGCLVGAGSGAQEVSFAPQSGSFTANFQLRRTSSSATGSFNLSNHLNVHTECSVCTNIGPNLAALDGPWVWGVGFTDVASLTANTRYDVRVTVNMPQRTYDLAIAPAGQSLQTVAQQYLLAPEQPQTAQLSVASLVGAGLEVCNFSVQGAAPPPTPTPTPTPTATPTPTPPGPTPTPVPPTTSSGWTTIVDSADTVKIYVSYSTGNDNNDGRTTQTPKKTVQGGFSALRDGSADQLLLKKGDIWPAAATSVGSFNKTGRGFTLSTATGQRTLTGALVISSYGTGARPVLKLPDIGFMTGAFFHRIANGNGNMAILGIAFEADAGSQCAATAIGWNGTGPGSTSASGNHMLFEDLRFKRFFRSIQFDGFGTDIQVRRSVFEDPCTNSRSGYSQPPVYVEDATDILVEENYIITRVYAVGDPHFVRRSYNQDNLSYIQDSNFGAINIRKNVYLNKVAGDMGPVGLAVRSPANIDDNLFSGMSIAISMGGRDTPPSYVHPEGVYGRMSGNVVLNGANLYPNDPDPNFGLNGYRGIGISLIAYDGSVQSVVSNNIIAHKAVEEPAPWEDMRGAAINIDPASYGPTRNVLIQSNISYDWTNGLHATAGSSSVSGVRFENNDVQCVNRNPNNFAPLVYTTSGSINIAYSGNRYYSTCNAQGTPEQAPNGTQQLISYPAPTRSLQTYATSIGLAPSIDALMDAIIQQQSRDTWNAQLAVDPMLQYIRAGFGR